MTVSELKAILPQLQSLRFHTVSDEGLIVYTRSYAALYNMVSVNALDNEFGAREIYRKNWIRYLQVCHAVMGTCKALVCARKPLMPCFIF